MQLLHDLLLSKDDRIHVLEDELTLLKQQLSQNHLQLIWCSFFFSLFLSVW
jgi:hypothetical protein